MFKKTLLLVLCLTVCAVTPLAAVSGHAKSYLLALTRQGFQNSGASLNYNQLAIDAAVQAESDLGVKIDIKGIDTMQSDAFRPYLGRYDLIIAVGGDVGGLLAQAVANYPTQKAALVDYDGQLLPFNACAFRFDSAEAAFLAGFIAASVAKKDQPLGFIGGLPFPQVQNMRQAFAAGAKRANPKVTMREVYVNDFFDAPAGKAAAEKLYDEGAAVIFHAAGLSGHGVIDAAVEKQRWVIGMVADQYPLAPRNMLTSVVLDLGGAIYQAVQLMEANAFPAGATIPMNLKSLGVHLGNTDNVPPGVMKQVRALANDIINNKVAVLG